MLIKGISGGQNGVDIAFLRAVKAAGFQTGGTMPAGFWTLDGPKPEYAVEFGVTEHESSAYVPRTFQNVRDSDGTIRIAVDFNSSGEKCTKRAIEQYDRPYFDVFVKDVSVFAIPPEIHPQAAAKWLIAKNIQILNGAGNSKKTAPGIEKWAERYFTAMLTAYQKLIGAKV
jgi:hypothetical protein